MLNPNWTDEECREATLEYLQGLGYRGDSLPSFLPGPRASNCPVANALRQAGYHNVEVSYWEVYASRDMSIFQHQHRWKMPLKVVDFILRVDAGLYPDLVPPPFKS